MKPYKLLISGIIASLILASILWNVRLTYSQQEDIPHTKPTYGFLNPFSPSQVIPAIQSSPRGWGYQFLVIEYPTRWFFIVYDLMISLGIILLVYSADDYNKTKHIPSSSPKPRFKLFVSFGMAVFILIAIYRAYIITGRWSLIF